MVVVGVVKHRDHLNRTTTHVMLSHPMPPEVWVSLARILENMFST